LYNKIPTEVKPSQPMAKVTFAGAFCWVCVIFFAQVVVSERLRRVHRGVRGGCRGANSPMQRFRGSTPKKNFTPGQHISRRNFSGLHFQDRIIFRWFFGTWFFANGFLFPVKELGFWTNPGHWVRVLDAAGSYMYIVL
jgi:hypothetical protein